MHESSCINDGRLGADLAQSNGKQVIGLRFESRRQKIQVFEGHSFLSDDAEIDLTQHTIPHCTILISIDNRNDLREFDRSKSFRLLRANSVVK